jgi:hypothetical protein
MPPRSVACPRSDDTKIEEPYEFNVIVDFGADKSARGTIRYAVPVLLEIEIAMARQPRTSPGTGAARPPLIVRALLYAFNVAAKATRHTGLRAKQGQVDLYYRLRENRRGRAVLKAVELARSPRSMRYRRRLARSYSPRIVGQAMTGSTGYALINPKESSHLTQTLATCERLFHAKRATLEQADVPVEGQLPSPVAKRRFLRNLLSNDDLRRSPELLDFALSDAAFGLATKYLGTIPYLNRIDLLYSVPRESDQKIASQLFHVDPEGLTQVKFFIHVFAVDEAEGPFTFIPADETARILEAIRTLRRRRGAAQIGRYTDEEIRAVGGSDAIVTVRGPQGAGVAIDTSRCLHLGSRVQPGAFRLCLYLQYCTTPERGNVFDVDRFRDDPIRYLAIKDSVRSAGTTVTAPHEMAG